jgi:hypothetical protein
MKPQSTPAPNYNGAVPNRIFMAWSSPQRTATLRTALMIAIIALCVRIFGALVLGEGAAFGPDGTGAQAAVFLGGHPYPLHIQMLKLFGADARALSMFCGSLNCVLLWHWGRRVGLGGAGGWLAATLPLSVFPGVLAAGDAPALTVLLLGVLMSTYGGFWPVLGGVTAALSVAVKPIALPALVLLVVHPMSLVGAAGGLLAMRQFIQPLWAPMAHGGILGSWWVSTGGLPPISWANWLGDGLSRLSGTALWGLIALVPLAALLGLMKAESKRLRLAALGPLIAAIVVAALFGDRLELRYLSAAFVVSLPFFGPLIKDSKMLFALTILGIWPTSAVLTQLAVERTSRDPQATVAAFPTVNWPQVNTTVLFDACSTDGATHLRNLAYQLAEMAPKGSTIITEARADGREGELFWPLQVLRPDLKVAVQ